MNLAVTAITAAERLPLPDHALRFGISRLVGRTRRRLAEGNGPTDRDFARSMTEWPIAVHTDEANAHVDRVRVVAQDVCGQHSGSAAAEDQPEGAEELRRRAIRHGH